MEYIYHHAYQKEIKYDEQGLKELITSQNPSLVFVYEALIAYARELAIYLLKLKELGITNQKINNDFLTISSGISLNVEYTEEKFFDSIQKLYQNLLQTKEFYLSVCKKNNLKPETFRSILKNPQELSFSDAILLGKELFFAKYQKFNPEEMSLYELLMNIAKSLYIYLIELNIYDEETCEAILALFGMKNSHSIFVKKLPGNIKKFLNINNRILRKLYEVRKERYGEIEPTDVSTSVRPNKAILVSGPDLRELELVLEATKDKGIDVYTHGNMLLAHSYPKFKTYSHFAGHYGGNLENYLFDFSEFPGSIFLTKYSLLNVENFYRGRVYSADVMVPKGIGIIKDDNFEPLIESSLKAEGFEEKTQNFPIKLNFSEKPFLEKITKITQKIEHGEIKYFFVIEKSNNTKEQKEYFDEFLNLLGNDCFVLSFSYLNPTNNVLYVDFYSSFPIIYKAFDILTRKISIEKLNPIVLFTKCEENTLTNMAYMKQIGVKKIYFADCSPNLFNPAFIALIRQLYDLKNFTNPQDDLKEMLS